jgi:hypothetical protein
MEGSNVTVGASGAVGAVVGSVIAGLLPFAPLYLGTAVIMGGVTASLIYYLVCSINVHV